MAMVERHISEIRRHEHRHGAGTRDESGERKTRRVVWLTAMTMGVEVGAGWWTGSMALLADGWHMGTHVLALGVSLLAYRLARRHASDGRFTFGTGKFPVLAGYTSSLFLGLAAVWMMVESLLRLLHPVPIAFTQAIGVTLCGLLVNLLSVLILHDHEHGQDHDHDCGHGEEHHHDEGEDESHGHHHDHSFRAAYLHVIADTMTSVLAVVALLSGRYLGFIFMDPVMGVVGGLVILRWAWGLLASTGVILVDGGVPVAERERVRELIESDGDSRVADLHLWHVGSHELAALVSVVSGQGRLPEEYRARLGNGFAHISVEVHPCRSEHCVCAAG